MKQRSLLDFGPTLQAFEAGELNRDATFALFQDLVDSDLITHLQGSYARLAEALIAAGAITGPAEGYPNNV